MNPWDQFTGANAGYVQELYERYQRDPGSVDEATRRAFAAWAPPSRAGAETDGRKSAPAGPDARAALAAFKLAESIRRFGHLAARLDPLGFNEPVGDPSLDAAVARPHADTLRQLPADIVGGPAAAGAANASRRSSGCARSTAAPPATTTTTCSCPTSASGCARRSSRASSARRRIPINSRELLDRITQVESFERFLHRTFPGKTRFSIEGLDMMIPILDEIISDAAAGGVKHVMIAMAHRGRLNVLAHILQKPYAQILAEFKDPLFSRSWRIDLGWMGDVKYHAGARVERRGDLPAIAGRLDAAQPEPPRGGRSGAERHGARGGHATSISPGRAALPHGAGARHPDSRRLRVPRPGRRRRNAEPVAARRLRGRRDDPHHRQQPARVHRRAAASRSAPATRAAWRAASRFRSRTSTPTMRSRASRRRGCRGPTGTGSSSTS